MGYYDDRTFRAGKVPIRSEVRKIYALPLPVQQIPEESPPAEPVQVPQWAKSGTTFDWYNPQNNSFAQTPNAPNMHQLKQQVGARWNTDDSHDGIRHTGPRESEQAKQGPMFGPEEEPSDFKSRRLEKEAGEKLGENLSRLARYIGDGASAVGNGLSAAGNAVGNGFNAVGKGARNLVLWDGNVDTTHTAQKEKFDRQQKMITSG